MSKSEQKQHADFHRKIMLRERLLPEPGAAYVPFIGDGDIAHTLYQGFDIYGADIDPQRVETARSRLPGEIITADCNEWPFPGVEAEFALADFDAYSEPYPSFRAFWQHAKRAFPLTVLFTDGHKQGIMRTGHWHKPDGTKEYLETTNERRRVFSFYFPKHILPWFTEYIAPWKVRRKMFYLRGMMLYWGAILEEG